MTAATSALEGESVVRTGGTPHEWDWPRPDLPIPLPPLVSSAVLFRRLVIGLREPAFGRAYRVTCWWAVAGAGLLIVARTVLAAEFAPFVTALVLVICGYVLIRVVSLLVFQRQQDSFETRWLAHQSEALRAHAFDVVRFTLRPDRARPSPAGVRHQVLNLADPHDVGRLMRQQVEDRAGRGNSRADIEFTYWPGAGERAVVERVRRELKDIAVHPVAGTTHVRVRFPEARYGRSSTGPRESSRTSTRTTYWFLSGPVRLTATEPDRTVLEGSPVRDSTASEPGSV